MSFRYRLPEGKPVGQYVRAPAAAEYHRAMSGAASDLVHSEAVSYASAALCAYHGYRRNGSLFWALVWAVAGKKIPIVAVPVAAAQGIGKKRTCTTE
jgi:hypothetical protein